MIGRLVRRSRRDAKLEYLSSFPAGSRLDAEQLLSLAHDADLIRLPAGASGRIGPRHHHVVLSGTVVTADEVGIVGIAGAGDTIGGPTGTFTLVALSDAEILVFDPRSGGRVTADLAPEPRAKVRSAGVDG
ncbi:MAG: hypothetical protein QOG64_993 [Acidimicrobiaceae bacterium]|nr:hypothetical protein [Acidimicrobiaceae bacterium]